MLLLRQALGFNCIDAHGFAHALCNTQAVAREHHHAAHSKTSQFSHRLRRVTTQLVLKTNRTQIAIAEHHVHAAHAFKLLFNRFHLRRSAGVQFGNPHTASGKHHACWR